jgi:hypothetical protein
MFDKTRTALLVAILGGATWFSNVSPAQQHSLAEMPNENQNPFDRIFDGKTLRGWDGDTNVWRVENGNLVGETTAEHPLKDNTFLIWRGGVTHDFDLTVEYRLSARGNSGIQYRSVELPDRRWVMEGYQADLDGHDRNSNGMRYTGQNYEEKGRGFLALPGQMTRVDAGKRPQVIASFSDSKQLALVIHEDGWNEYHLVVSGHLLVHALNGCVTSIVVDEDASHRRDTGLLGLQVHDGPPMKVEFRNFRFRSLAGTPN